MKGLSERANGATLALIANTNLKPIHDMNTTPQAPAPRNPRNYVLRPFPLVGPAAAPKAPAPVPLPPRQPLPTAVIDPNKPMLKLGLDVHLQFIVAVVQKGHGSPQAPRKFTADQLVAYVRKWVAEGFQVFCVQESCGFGFVLHRQLVAAGAQSFLITPIALNGRRKTDKLDSRVLCLRLSRWLDGNRDELCPIRIPTETEQRLREKNRGQSRTFASFAHRAWRKQRAA